MLIAISMMMVVDILLLFASGRMLGLQLHPLRILSGSVVGGGLTLLAYLSGMEIMSHFLWYMLMLVITALTAIGIRCDRVPGVVLFLLLHLSLGNMTDSGNEMLSTILGAAGITLACILVRKRSCFVDVMLTYGGKTLCFAALRDTGNELRDPVTGESVLVVSQSIAEELTGLTIPELADPVSSITMLPGLRLIPYQTVANSGLLLGLRVADARIGNRQGSVLVALSPKNLGRNYQGLTGGMLG